MQSSNAHGSDLDWPHITAFRRRLHMDPELSEQEHRTAVAVEHELSDAAPPDRMLTGLGRMQTGLGAVYEGAAEGPTVMLRCELDALPIQEAGDCEHRSRREGVAHLCGHDGHMATMVAVAHSLHRRRPARGRAVLLFQPAEETGTGAEALLNDPRFTELAPQFVFGFHNIPGYETGTLLLREGTFAAASVGFIVTFSGSTSHSSYPEYGRNPTAAVARLLDLVNGIETERAGDFQSRSTGTVTSARLGAVEIGPNFGTAPGEAEVMGVLRAYHDDDLATLKTVVSAEAERLAREAALECSVEWREEFAATENHDRAVRVLSAVAERHQRPCRVVEDPFRWSEDFGRYLQVWNGAFFGIGSGLRQPQLHSDTYDYPDELIPVGAAVYREILDALPEVTSASE